MTTFFPPNNKLTIRKKGKTPTQILEREDLPFEEFTDEELHASKGGVLVFDIECYPNYFLIAFQCFYSKKVVYFELVTGVEYNVPKLLWVMHNFCIVGFNSNYYDMPLAWLSMKSGVTTETLKNVTDFIIQENWRASDVEKAYDFKMGQVNTIDLIEVAPLSASLKTYSGRLHAERLQDLPYPPNKVLTLEEINKTRNYCINDLESTALLLKELSPQLELRHSMSLQYGQDLRSKSDAQLAETVLSGEIRKLSGKWPKRPTIEPGTVYRYQVPSFIEYKTPLLQRMLEIVRNADFVIGDNGQVIEPKEFEQLKALQIGSSVYRMGIGGLHSTEECISHLADNETLLIDRDVASYYPNIILTQGLYPKHLGEDFLTVYRTIVERRLAAKADVKQAKKDIELLRSKLEELGKDKVKKEYVRLEKLKKDCEIVTNTLKICVNGSFGKLGSKYSVLYSPDLMLQVTISGQLCLLFLIETLELSGIPIVSGNTDGIIIKCPANRYDELNSIIADWERITGFETEETRYKATYNRDVNNFIIVKEDNTCKVKGCYSEKGSALNSRLSKNPEMLICSDAVQKFLTVGTPVEETILNCKDFSRFVTVRNVKGGGEKDGYYLGKVVRFYFAKGTVGTINYVSNGNKVPNSEGARPVMDLPPSFPTDIDYDKYINKANDILYEIGYYKKEQQVPLF